MYQRLVGCLIYLFYTGPYITYEVRCVRQFMHAPSESHMQAVYRILNYLKETPGLGLFFTKSENKMVKIYTDADWTGSMKIAVPHPVIARSFGELGHLEKQEATRCSPE